MSANFYTDDWYEWYKDLKQNTKHMHLSDSYGINGDIDTYFIIAYQDEIYRCDIRDYDYSCYLLEPKIN